MKFIPPAGAADGAPYVDGNRSAGIKGSIVPAKAIDHPQREIVHVIDFFGLTPEESDTEQLRKAIEAAIAAATGGGDTSQFLLVSQARARLPIFPEIQSADNRMNVTSPSAGTVQVPSAVNFQHRGIFPISTSSYVEEDRTFTTTANKTYHLRWTPVGGFALKDLADSGYNPTALAESNMAFDSAYDDMLIARVVTSAGNVATITNLANRDRLATEAIVYGANGQSIGDNGARWNFSHTLNWARRPATFSVAVARSSTGPGSSNDDDFNISALGSNPEISATQISVDRYGWRNTIMRDYAQDLDMHFSAGA